MGSLFQAIMGSTMASSMSHPTQMSPESVWIGLVGVRAVPGNDVLGDAVGAYVNILCWTNCREQFVQCVTEAMQAFGFSVEEMEDMEPLETRLLRGPVGEQLAILAEEVRTTKQPRCGTFHSFAAEDADVP